MTAFELAAWLASFCYAATRLLTASRPLWSNPPAWFPQWLQVLLPGLVVALPQLAAELGLVQTRLDLVETLVVAVTTIAASMHGKGPKSPPPPLSALLLLSALTLPACASWRPVTRTVNDVAGDLCAVFFAEKKGLSLEEAGRTFCRTHEQLQPWLDQVLAAQQAAGRAALEQQSGAQSAP